MPKEFNILNIKDIFRKSRKESGVLVSNKNNIKDSVEFLEYKSPSSSLSRKENQYNKTPSNLQPIAKKSISIDSIPNSVINGLRTDNIKTLNNTKKQSKFSISEDEFLQILDKSPVNELHKEVLVLIHELQQHNPNNHNSILSTKDLKSLSNTMAQDIKFLGNSDIDKLNDSENNKEIINYVNNINSIILPKSFTKSLHSASKETALIKLKSIQNIIEKNFKSIEKEELGKNVSMTDIEKSTDWRAAFMKNKIERSKKVTRYRG